MRRHRHRPALADRLLAALIVCVGLSICPLPGVAAEAGASASASARTLLHLEVWIDGYTTNQIAPFTELPDGTLSTQRAVFDDLDIKLPGPAGEEIRLSDVAGLTYRLDRATQVIHLTVAPGLRRAKLYDASADRERLKVSPAAYSALLNYSMYASALQGTTAAVRTGKWYGFNGVNANLDGRLVTPYGNFYQSALVGTIPTYYTVNQSLTDVNALRYDTAFVHVDPDSFMTYRVGDFVNGAMGWSQPVRMAGIQIQRNFSARPDIVTRALPSFTGSAAAPSTVDVYINGLRSYSQQVGAGPFELSNLPTVNGSGEARIVVRDASGREVETKQVFYNAPTLLKPGVYEASAEAGVVRYNYGITSNDYGDRAAGSANLRAGITDFVTGEVHTEAGLGMANGGAGLVVNVSNRAVVSGSVTGSVNSKSDTGIRLYGSLDTRLGPVTVHAESSRGLGKYTDLATAAARLRPTTAEEIQASTINPIYRLGYSPAVTRDLVSLIVPVPFDTTTVSLTWVRAESEFTGKTEVAMLSHSRPFIGGSTLFANAYTRLDSTRDYGLYAGVSISLGDTNYAGSVNASTSGNTYIAEATKPVGLEPGDWGYRIRDGEGSNPLRSATLGYRGQSARLEAGVYQTDSTVRQTLEVTGSVVGMENKVYFANTIDDGFAVVNANAQGVRVMVDNRFTGETGEDGTMLVTGLRSNQKNLVAIDPSNLPVTAEIETPEAEVVPATKSGVFVDFKVNREGSSAIVVLKRPDGSFVGTGFNGRLEGSSEKFMIGYDGQTFIKGLSEQNTVVVKLDNAECRASFPFRAKENTQVVIGPVVCE